MTSEILHTLQFVERSEYIRAQNEDGYYADHVCALTASRQLVVPDTGAVVDFGWYEDEDTGERVERTGFDRSGVDYNRTQSYKVLEKDHHYHHNQTTSDHGGSLAVNRIETTTTVIVEEYEGDE